MDNSSPRMRIKKINIENFKCFKGKFSLVLNEGLNILVGDNEAGKSTILEAIHLTLTGVLNGRYLKNELTQYLFNIDVVSEYLQKIEQGEPAPLPDVLIELFIEGEDLATFLGDGNRDGKKECGLSLKIAFDDKYQPEYEALVDSGNIKTIPIEYYDIYWSSFAREAITARSIPLKSALIDSSSHRYRNGSDMYISRIIKDSLEAEDVVNISQAYRNMRDVFRENEAIKKINTKIEEATKISSKKVKISIDLSSKNAWEQSLMTYLDDVPFHHIGKGEQCIVKTKLALSHKKSQEANILLLEEPENHLSHPKLNQLIHDLREHEDDKQMIVSTHSSFVANKLGLESLILLSNYKTVKLKDLSSSTKRFFKKLSGYDTLRLILCKKAILVEGDSDELIVQKAYAVKNDNRLPIEDGIDVISVGNSFLRFLEIAEQLKATVVVVTDNDGDVESVKSKYENFLGEKAKAFISICFDQTIETGDLTIKNKPFNYNTLEPKLLKENSLDCFNKLFGKEYTNIDDMHKYMRTDKAECALKIFDTTEDIKFPQYILDAIKGGNDEQ